MFPPRTVRTFPTKGEGEDFGVDKKTMEKQVQLVVGDRENRGPNSPQPAPKETIIQADKKTALNDETSRSALWISKETREGINRLGGKKKRVREGPPHGAWS